MTQKTDREALEAISGILRDAFGSGPSNKVSSTFEYMFLLVATLDQIEAKLFEHGFTEKDLRS